MPEKEQEQRHICYDHDLEIESYRLSGIVQKFPNHFHDYYVIGFIKGGARHLWCKGKEYDLAPGDMILFNPRDNHCCAPINDQTLDYRAVNIAPQVMERLAQEIAGAKYTPYFTSSVVPRSDIAPSVGELYDAIVAGEPRLKKEEAFYFLLEQVLQEYSAPFDQLELAQPDRQIQAACDYMEQNYDQNITLDQLLAMTGYGKSYLLRQFTKQVGVSPYRYLQTMRLDRAKKLLEQGTAPVDAASLAGFSDQSHFTNFFKEFIGLTPKQYQRIFEGGDQP